MPKTQKELDKIITEIQENYKKAWNSKDAKKVADFYDKNGVLVYVGKCAIYGRDAIAENLAKFINEPCEYKLTFESTIEAGDGEYIIHKDAIAENLAKFINEPCEYKLTFESTVEAGDGEYIIHKGQTELATEPKQICRYEQIFKRQPDGSYLIYHDECAA
uniref:Nuclear transport factor 2 domain-containing protein n=1 Tax=Panagrolaimus sp. JU765 TaxID=591449 RepID=A0AC34QLG1_9BILA